MAHGVYSLPASFNENAFQVCVDKLLTKFSPHTWLFPKHPIFIQYVASETKLIYTYQKYLITNIQLFIVSSICRL